MTQRRLDGRTAVVIHVGSPLGRASALRLSEEGASVVLVDPILAEAEATRALIEEAGGLATVVQAGFGDPDEIKRAVSAVETGYECVDALVVAAGALDWWGPADDSMSNWEQSLRVNLLTPIFYTRAFRSLLTRSRSGAVVIYGSVDGLHGNPRVPAYSVARGGLIPFVHTEAHALAANGVRVNLIAGAGILPHGPEAPPSSDYVDMDALLRETPAGRLAMPEDVAGVVAFLASDDAAYVTGAVIKMDGGRTAITPATGLTSSTFRVSPDLPLT